MVRVAICQYAIELGNKEKNVELSLEWLDRAGKNDPDLVVLPELITTGFCAGEKHLELAERIPGPATESWGKKAKEYGMHVIGGFGRLHDTLDGVIYNSAALIGPSGDVMGIYDKCVLSLYLHSLPWPTDEREIFRAGESLPVFNTSIGKIGIQICADSLYELARILAFKGAQIIVRVNNNMAVPELDEGSELPGEILRCKNRATAFDNGVYMVVANKVGAEAYTFKEGEYMMEFFGGSHIVDPCGNILKIAKFWEPDLITADFDLSEVAKARWKYKQFRELRSEFLERLWESSVDYAQRTQHKR